MNLNMHYTDDLPVADAEMLASREWRELRRRLLVPETRLSDQPDVLRPNRMGIYYGLRIWRGNRPRQG